MKQLAILRVYLLDRFHVCVGDRHVSDDEWRRRKKAAALLKLLALSPGHRLVRDQILESLWPETDVAAAANSLHQTLHVARRIIEPTIPRGPFAYLHFQGDHLTIAQDEHVWVDVTAFSTVAIEAKRAPRPETIDRALDHYAGDLLPDDLYDDWIDQRRRELRSTYHDLLDLRAQRSVACGDQPAAIAALERLIASDPTHEAAHRTLMVLQAESGQRHLALRTFDRLREALRREVDVAPDPETTRLHRALLQGTFPAPATLSPPTPSSVSTVVDTLLPVGASTRDLATAEGRPPDRGNTSGSGVGLPTHLTRFIGRESELAKVIDLLTTRRLVTLTGSGGGGKTRLAIEAARRVADTFPGGVWWVDLATVRDPALVGKTVAAAINPGETALRAPSLVVREGLRSGAALLVLDNGEHVLDGCARVIDGVLRAYPNLRVLLTSREPIRLAGEHSWRVPPMAHTHLSMHDGVAPGPPSDAEQLFLDRARLADPTFTPSVSDARLIARICARLDGLPLAIELAAAWAGTLSLVQIDEQLTDCLRFLTRGSRLAVPRQQTMRGTLDWSHDLLFETERVLFRRLSVFAGGASLDAIRTVSAGNELDAAHLLNLVGQLVDKSLVIADSRDDRVRYRLLEPVRQYSLERLANSGEARELRQRHAAWCVALVGQAAAALDGPDQAQWIDQFDAEHDNLRAAFDRAIDHEESETALAIAAGCWRYWRARGYVAEGLRRLTTALASDELSSSASQRIRTGAIEGSGTLALLRGDLRRASAQLRDALDRQRALGDVVAAANIMLTLAVVAIREDDQPEGARFASDALAVGRALNDHRLTARALATLARVDAEWGNADTAVERIDEAIDLGDESGDDWLRAHLLATSAQVRGSLGEFVLAAQDADESLGLFRSLKDRVNAAMALATRGGIVAASESPELAMPLLTDALAELRAIGAAYDTGEVTIQLANLARRRGDRDSALTLARDGLTLARRVGARRDQAAAMAILAWASAVDANADQIVDLLRRAVRLAPEPRTPTLVRVIMADLGLSGSE